MPDLTDAETPPTGSLNPKLPAEMEERIFIEAIAESFRRNRPRQILEDLANFKIISRYISGLIMGSPRIKMAKNKVFSLVKISDYIYKWAIPQAKYSKYGGDLQVPRSLQCVEIDVVGPLLKYRPAEKNSELIDLTLRLPNEEDRVRRAARLMEYVDDIEADWSPLIEDAIAILRDSDKDRVFRAEGIAPDQQGEQWRRILSSGLYGDAADVVLGARSAARLTAGHMAKLDTLLERGPALQRLLTERESVCAYRVGEKSPWPADLGGHLDEQGRLNLERLRETVESLIQAGSRDDIDFDADSDQMAGLGLVAKIIGEGGALHAVGEELLGDAPPDGYSKRCLPRSELMDSSRKRIRTGR